MNDGDNGATVPPFITVAERTLSGDLTQILFDEIKALPDLWQKMSEAEQVSVIDRARDRIADGVTQACMIIAGGDIARVAGKIDNVTFKDGIKAVLKFDSKVEGRHELADRIGEPVMLAMIDPQDFLGGFGKVKADPDQPGFSYEAPAP